VTSRPSFVVSSRAFLAFAMFR